MTPPGDVALSTAAARRLLDRYAERLPDLSGLVVLVPNQRAGMDFTRALARLAGRPALIPPDVVPLKRWAERHAVGRVESAAARLAKLHAALRHEAWLGQVDKWALAEELLHLADALSAERTGNAAVQRLRTQFHGQLEREIALVEAVWRSLNDSDADPQARYARALDAAAQTFADTPCPILGFDLGPLTGIERRFLAHCAAHAPVDILIPDPTAPCSAVLTQAWQMTDPPLLERAQNLAHALPESPLATIRLAPASHLEAEARAVVAWVADQLSAGARDIALIALDRETTRRVRALLERCDVRVADETGWALSTTAAAAVVDRWLECVARDFPHTDLLDLLKSPFVLGDPVARQDQVLRFELALRRCGVAQGLAEMQRLARPLFDGEPDWLARLAASAHDFPRTRAPLAVWLERLLASLDALDARASLIADAAGWVLVDTLAELTRDLVSDTEKYSFAEWRRWLDRALESASFRDESIESPVCITSLAHARGRRFDAVALIGADARHLPPRPAPGLFSQATRATLGLPTAHDDALTATADLLALVAPGPALFSWQAWHDDEPNPASPLVLRLDALHQAAWGVGLARQPSGAPPTRTSPPVTPSAQPAPTVSAAHLPRRYSASSYQTLLDCPYRFFVERVLGVRSLDEADDPLDKSDYGTALHRILKRFHDSDPPRDHAAALAQLAALSRAEFADLPAYTAASWASRWEPIQPAYIDTWLAWAAQGWCYASGETPFSQRCEIPGLGDVDLMGVLDRVDTRTDADGFEARAVFDYKTGSADSLKKKNKDPAEAVQLPFYAWLAEAAAAFLPLSRAPVEAIELPGETDVGGIAGRLPALLEALAAGAPMPASGVDAVCQYCDARGVCRKGSWHG